MNTKPAYFVTGTDTGAGKTLVTGALLYALGQQGVRAAGMKPVAAGAELQDGVWHNEDVDFIAASSPLALPTDLTTSYLLQAATAPHIAAAQEGVTIDPDRILDSYVRVAAAADAVVVEGVGGFRVPLADDFDTADLAQRLGLPVIMVVGLRLGCINHALLTAEAIAVRGLTLAGWIANVIDIGMDYGMAYIDTLTQKLPAPMLGCVPRLPAPLPSAAASHLDLSSLPGWPASPSST